MRTRLLAASLAATVLAVATPSRAEEPARKPLAPTPPAQPAPATAPSQPAQAPQAAPRYRVTTAEAPRYSIAQGKGSATLMLNPETGASAASLNLLEFQPGAAVPEHVHTGSVEILYCQEGEAEMTVAGQTVRVGKGDAVYIPAGTKHSAKIISTTPLRAVQIYVGPGPELRFTTGPRLNPSAPAAPAQTGEQPGKR